MTDAQVFGVRAVVDHLEIARTLIQDLERDGIPPDAIGLLGPDSDSAGSDLTEGEAISETARSAAIGGTTGAIVGGVLGSMVPLAVPGIGPVLAAGLGAVFGAGVGGSAGGMSSAKYNSRAWQETFQSVKEGRFVVSVEHADVGVVNAAAGRLGLHEEVEPIRFEYPDPAK